MKGKRRAAAATTRVSRSHNGGFSAVTPQRGLSRPVAARGWERPNVRIRTLFLAPFTPRPAAASSDVLSRREILTFQ
jgi:hypothetical protein